MSAFAVMLFGAAFLAAIWTLVASVRPQLPRFAALLRPASALPVLPPRLSRVTVRAVPARLPNRLPLRAAA
ncbi:hypothetical protein IAG41_05140 [Sphingomonas sp. JC676]|uniref:hypothetical protein n=1 Tax=Sphingomonas sp. JC676 TaxID=2768065 RepID=UPI001657D9D4|nr:hypothetical protein [Sphingomonas sp. JC676]MBC9031770.1 hypothetical protein [Sphingomonas sp. JC676]